MKVERLIGIPLAGLLARDRVEESQTQARLGSGGATEGGVYRGSDGRRPCHHSTLCQPGAGRGRQR